jgi:hypothetical protein
MLHGSGHAEVMVGVRWRSCHVMVAAWHGGGGGLHGLVVVVAVMLWQLRHGGGSGGSNSGHVTPQWLHGMVGSHMTWWWWWQPRGSGGVRSGDPLGSETSTSSTSRPAFPDSSEPGGRSRLVAW